MNVDGAGRVDTAVVGVSLWFSSAKLRAVALFGDALRQVTARE
jgi:hypothetical protein